MLLQVNGAGQFVTDTNGLFYTCDCPCNFPANQIIVTNCCPNGVFALFCASISNGTGDCARWNGRNFILKYNSAALPQPNNVWSGYTTLPPSATTIPNSGSPNPHCYPTTILPSLQCIESVRTPFWSLNWPGATSVSPSLVQASCLPMNLSFNVTISNVQYPSGDGGGSSWLAVYNGTFTLTITDNLSACQQGCCAGLPSTLCVLIDSTPNTVATMTKTGPSLWQYTAGGVTYNFFCNPANNTYIFNSNGGGAIGAGLNSESISCSPFLYTQFKYQDVIAAMVSSNPIDCNCSP